MKTSNNIENEMPCEFLIPYDCSRSHYHVRTSKVLSYQPKIKDIPVVRITRRVSFKNGNSHSNKNPLKMPSYGHWYYVFKNPVPSNACIPKYVGLDWHEFYNSVYWRFDQPIDVERPQLTSTSLRRGKSKRKRRKSEPRSKESDPKPSLFHAYSCK